jgi:two-component system OmpR family sensor kinase
VSLRARLIAVLLALAALGLVALAAITYAEQRSFLVQRVDDQTRAAVASVNHQLEPEHFRGPRPQRMPGPPPGAPGFVPGPNGPDAGRGPDADVVLPPGTYGQRRDASGAVIATAVITYGQAAPPAPKLPARIPLGRRITVGSVSGDLRYRVLAVPTLDLPGTTIVAVPLTDVDQTLNRLLVVEGLVIAGVLAVLAALSWLLVRFGLRPLERMGRTADAIAAGDLSRRVSPADERTEVGRLGLALNGMLAQIEKAFAERQQSENRLRRFLADASHELRTPLASIRGYAELFRIGAAREPAEAEKAMSRIEDESMRMGALVEDLLALARLDQLPEAARNPVDLSRLAGDAADDARAAAPDRSVELTADDEVTVLGDASQLRQVIGNLTRNALVHTPAGTAVELRVAVEGDDALLEVRDHGPGLPAGDTGALFERFWRADPGRERGPAGAGLGLSIVAAIVAAHGGRVSAENAAGGGARFTVRLPVRAPVPGEQPEPASLGPSSA